MAKVTGSMGAPPPGAPQEVSQPISAEMRAQMAQQARANERELAPLTYGQGAVSGILPPGQPAQAGRPAADFFDPPVEPVGPPRHAQVVGAPETAPARPAVIERGANYQPAASDSESPSRGIPKPVSDPGKAITGGFGEIGEATYFPLTGDELKNLILTLMDRLVGRIESDLRFTLATTYPRVSARVVIEVDGYADAKGIEIPLMVAWERTPLEEAHKYGDKVVFVVAEEHVEMTPEGESVTPPNEVRTALGLEVPRKRAIQAPHGQQVVDVTW